MIGRNQKNRCAGGSVAVVWCGVVRCGEGMGEGLGMGV
jgi:hypothetical protein